MDGRRKYPPRTSPNAKTCKIADRRKNILRGRSNAANPCAVSTEQMRKALAAAIVNQYTANDWKHPQTDHAEIRESTATRYRLRN
jgi:hypothetical protein